MLKFLFFLNLILIFCKVTSAQNLVPNPSFEQYDSCLYPIVDNTHQGLKNWGTPKTTGVSYCSGYYNRCFLKQGPNGYYYYDTLYNRSRSGQGFVLLNLYDSPVIYQNHITYIQTKLITSLKANCFYAVSFYLKLIGYYGVAGTQLDAGYTDAIGAYFSAKKVTTSDTFLTAYIPQIENQSGRMLKDSVYYMLVSDTFKAVGNERWITIGNFKNNKNTLYKRLKPPQYFTNDSIARYCIDDVSVIAIPPPGLALSLGKDSVVCDTSDLKIKLTAQSGFSSYLWSTGETSQSIVVNKLGKYSLQADFGCGNLYDTIEIKTVPKPSILPLKKDTVICLSKPFKFSVSAPVGYTSYAWSTGSKSKAIEIAAEGEYIVKGLHQCWPFYDTIRVSVFKPPISLIQTPGDTSICAGDSIQVLAAAGFAKYFWNGVAGSKTLQVKEEGKYFLIAQTKEQCVAQDTLVIQMLNPPASVNLPDDTMLCLGQTVFLDAGGKQAYDSYLWNNGSEEKTIVAFKSGNYKIKIFNQCFSKSDSIQITFSDCTPEYPNLLTPNGDGKNESFLIKTPIERQLSFEVYNRWGQKIFSSDHYQNDWEPSEEISNGIYYFMIGDVLLGKQFKGWVEVVR